MRKKIFTGLLGFFSIFAAHHGIAETSYTEHINNIVKNTHLDPKVVELAMKAYKYAQETTHVKKDILTIVDYSKPSSEKRLYVIDLKTDQLLLNTRVAHGKNTGLLTSDSFSNRANSNQTSLGVFVTTDIYQGKHGTSLRIAGLEKGINDNVASRAVVIHSASYMSDDFLKSHGYSGRSSGCLAVRELDISKLIQFTSGGSVIFSYAAPENHDPNLENIHLT